MTNRYTRIAVAALASGLIVLGLAVRFGPSLLLVVALAAPRAEAWLARIARAPGPEEIAIVLDGRRLQADLYRPASPRGAILLVHGLSRAGRRHPELMRLARLLARGRTLVLVPQFEGLAAFRLSGREVDDIRSGVRYLTEIRAGPVAIAGFSFGAGPALLAAADLPSLRVVGSFGGYAELRNVISFITTGVHFFGGQRYVRRQEEYNRWKLLSLLAGFAQNGRDRGLLEAIADRKLTDPAAATTASEHRLGGEGRAMLALVLNRREEAVAPLLAGLPPRARAAIDGLSPLAVVPRLPGRLLIAHGADDDSIPFTESLRLAEAAKGRARIAVLQTFHHTGPQPFWQSLGRRAVDGLHLLRLVDDLLVQ